jgi:serine/threonine-protein kinase
MEGKTLAEHMAGGAPMEWKKAARLVAQLAEALHHAHSKKIVHRDIKPANIMLLDSGQAKVMDFGIARLEASTLTTTGEFFGTPAYMSPEQARGDPVDPRTDLFSLGCVLHQLLTGKKPFDGPTLPAIFMKVMQETPAPPSRTQPGLPPSLDDVVARALAKDRDARYADGKSMAEDLEDVVAGRPPRHTSPGPPPLPETAGHDTSRLAAVLSAAAGTAVIRPQGASGGKRRRTLFLGLAAAVLTALGFAAALAVSRGGPAAVLPASGPSPTVPPALPGQLEITVQHPLKTGVLKVWVDDTLVLEEGLEGRVARKILGYKGHKGTLRETVDVPAGDRTIRVQVEGDGFAGSRRIKGTFSSGVRLRLNAEVSGFLKKDLKLGWSS